MKRYWYVYVAVVCAAAVAVAGCGKGKGGVDPMETEVVEAPARGGPILAEVGDQVITLEEFNKKISRLPDNIKVIAESNKMVYLDNLVMELLLYREALRRGLNKDEEIQELFQEAKKGILISRLAKDEVQDKLDITDDGLRQYYVDNKENFMSPELIRASHILVDTEREAQEIADKLSAGALFEELAKKYSKDTTGKRGGDLGYFSAGQMVPEFEEACLKLNVGQISAPLQTQFGYHIIKLTDRKASEPMEYDSVKDRIETMMRTQQSRALFDNFVSKLKSETECSINTELIAPGEGREDSAE